MDVHRCRFVPFQPSGINSVAFSHTKTRSARHGALARMAVGRANGDVEIWNPANGAWQQETILRGGKDRSIESLVWVNEPDTEVSDGRTILGKSRLFSVGYSSTVTEWDLEKGRPKRHASGQHGHIWCMAAIPAEAGKADSQLVVGTNDGELVVYSTEDGDLRFQRVLVRSPTKKAQIVSIAFQTRKIAIVGCSDSTVRAYDITNGHMLRRMTVGADLVGGASNTIVWAVQCLANGNIVSGDSTGHLTFFDGKTYTQMQRIQGHKQDILSLAVSFDGKTIFSGGMDRKTVLYKQGSSSDKRWGKSWGRRYHEHDVKSLATFESGPTSVLVSGGPDTNLAVMPLKQMGKENHRILSSLPQQPPLASAAASRFVVSWWERQVHIWVIHKSANDIMSGADEDIDLSQNRKLLKTIIIKGDSNISDATISECGTFLVVSTSTDVKAFKIDLPTVEEPGYVLQPSDLEMSTVEVPARLRKLGASKLQLSRDLKWLCVVSEGSAVRVVEVDREEDDIRLGPIRRLRRLQRSVPRYIRIGGMGNYERTITHTVFSPDSKMLATADLAGYIDTWVLNAESQHGDAAKNGEPGQTSSGSESSDSEEESVAEGSDTWTRNPNGKLLPKLPAAPAVLSFSAQVPGEDGATDYILLGVTGQWTVNLFHPLQGSLTPWSRRHPKKALPAPFQDLLDLAKGCFWQGTRVWIYGVSFLGMLDTSLDLPKPSDVPESEAEAAGMKRKRTGYATGAGSKMAQSSLVPHRISRHVNGAADEDIDMDDVTRSDDEHEGVHSDDDEAADAAAAGQLVQTRNGQEGGSGGELSQATSHKKSWWMTYKYRPVFGVVALSETEVVLVERPLWDVDMPDRFIAGEPWER